MMTTVLISILYMSWGFASMFPPVRLGYLIRSFMMALTGQVGVSIATGFVAGFVASAW